MIEPWMIFAALFLSAFLLAMASIFDQIATAKENETLRAALGRDKRPVADPK